MQDLFGNEIIEPNELDETETKLSNKKTGPNLFIITDALFAGDKKKIWNTYRALTSEGVTAEELMPIIWWALKSILLVANDVPGEVKPFVASKAKRFLTKFSRETIITMSDHYIDAVLRARGGSRLSDEIEQWLLTLPF